MKNQIDVSVEFSYQGQDHAPTATLDLDTLMEGGGQLGDFYPVLARANGIDTYSYLYEVMEMHELSFRNPQGLAVECYEDGEFDMNRFAGLWYSHHEQALLAPIAREHLGVADLSQQPALREALLAAFRLGKQQR